IVIFYGPDYCALYNDAYIVTMGDKHPGYLGRPGREMWAEAWSVLQDLFDGVVAADESYWAADYLFMLERYGFLEETYFDISYDPIRTADGSVGGVFCIVTETPGRGLNARRVPAPRGRGPPPCPTRRTRPGWGRGWPRCSARTTPTCRSPRSTSTTRTTGG